MEQVKVRLRKPTRVFTFLCEGVDLKRDERCIVKSERGLELGTCVLPPEPCPPEMEERFEYTVLRKATVTDESDFLQILNLEKQAWDTCLKRIEERKLAMKLVDVEYTFDRHKVVFYFTAEDRVDFRELVRDLAKDLKARIELRHIQVRDEAKIVGGLGMCGRELCCSTWLTEFKPISMKMAKRQNLSLNPSKISGQCGRLLCCLAYENELYKNKKSIVMAEREEALAEEAAAAPDEPAEEGPLTWEELVPGEEVYSAYAGGRPPSIEELEDPSDPSASVVIEYDPDADGDAPSEDDGAGAQDDASAEDGTAGKDGERKPGGARRPRGRRRPKGKGRGGQGRKK